MGSTLSIQVEEFINEAGKVPRVQVYRRFELVGKRFVDQAIEELAQSRRLVVGVADVAPIKAQAAEAGEPKKRKRKIRAKPEKRRTIADDVLAVLAAGQRYTREEIAQRLPERSEGVVDRVLGRMVRRGQLYREPYKGYWLPCGEPPESRQPKDRVLAAFRPGEVLQSREVNARLPDLGRSTIGKALAALCRDNRVCTARLRGYWLPGTVS